MAPHIHFPSSGPVASFHVKSLNYAPSTPLLLDKSFGSSFLPSHAAVGKKVAGSPPVSGCGCRAEGPVGVSGGSVSLEWTPLCTHALAPTYPLGLRLLPPCLQEEVNAREC